MYLIRNKILRRLVTDKKRNPLEFETVDKAKAWLNLNFEDSSCFTIVSEDIQTYKQEHEEYLKLHFQKVV